MTSFKSTMSVIATMAATAAMCGCLSSDGPEQTTLETAEPSQISEVAIVEDLEPCSNQEDVPNRSTVSGENEPKVFCSMLSVTNDHGTYEIEVAVLSSATDPLGSGRDVVAYHPGGPGVSPVDALTTGSVDLDLDKVVVITWDGITSGSNPTACGEDSMRFATERSVDPNTAVDADLAGSVAEECKILETQGGAWEAAAELEAIRTVFDLGQIQLLVHSYGTAIAEAYLSMYGNNVGRAVLDGPVALSVSWEERVEAIDTSIKVALRELGDVSPEEFALRREKILKGQPTVGQSNRKLTESVYNQAALSGLSGSEFWDSFIEATNAAEGGDASNLWDIGQNYFTGLDRSVFYQSWCRDVEMPQEPSGYFSDEASGLVNTFATSLAPCAKVPLTKPSNLSDDISTEAEILVVANSSDPLTPIGLVDDKPGLLASAVVCETDVIGHTNYWVEEPKKLMQDFLYEGERPQCLRS